MGNTLFHNRLVRSVIFVVSFYLIVSLSRSIVTLWQKENIVVEEEKRLVTVRKKYGELQERLNQLESPTYIEEQARNKLGLGKEGDYMVILPPTIPTSEVTPTPVFDNWQKWWQLFVK